MTKMAPMADSGIANAAVDGCLRVARSCGVTEVELVLEACEVDVAGRLEDTLVLDGLDSIGFGLIGPAEVDGRGFEGDETVCDEAVADGSIESG